MRIVWPLPAALALSACAANSPALNPSAAATVSTPVQVDTYCRGVARQRAVDAARNFVPRDTLQVVFDYTYTDCVDWQMTHTVRG
jgi:hypothetical protein